MLLCNLFFHAVYWDFISFSSQSRISYHYKFNSVRMHQNWIVAVVFIFSGVPSFCFSYPWLGIPYPWLRIEVALSILFRVIWVDFLLYDLDIIDICHQWIPNFSIELHNECPWKRQNYVNCIHIFTYILGQSRSRHWDRASSWWSTHLIELPSPEQQPPSQLKINKFNIKTN